MTEPFVGQIQPMGFNFAPKGWAQCDGQTLNIAQNTALFSLLGTTYGGNGTTTLSLPDLRGRVPMHFGNFQGNTYTQGEAAGWRRSRSISIKCQSIIMPSTAPPPPATILPPVAGAALGTVAGTGENFYAP